MPDVIPPERAETLPPQEELYCFVDQGRPCSSECVAYEKDLPNDVEYQTKSWAHCLVLLNVHRTGKHLVVLASSGSKVVNYIADKLRTQQPQPPKGG